MPERSEKHFKGNNVFLFFDQYDYALAQELLRQGS